MSPDDKKIILIIEDDEVLLRSLYLTFHENGHTIASSTDGETALKMTERIRPDLILLDLLIPKISGFEYLKDIKSNEILRAIPVIVLSNLGDEESIKKAKDLGALDYFIKSNTDLSELAEKVNKIIKP